MRKVIGIGGLIGMFAMAAALGSFVKVFNDTYKVNPASALGKAKCMICHTTKMGGAMNAYGADLKKALKGSKTLTAKVLHSIDALDSDKDGAKNGAEIKAGKLPGAKG